MDHQQQSLWLNRILNVVKRAPGTPRSHPYRQWNKGESSIVIAGTDLETFNNNIELFYNCNAEIKATYSKMMVVSKIMDLVHAAFDEGTKITSDDCDKITSDILKIPIVEFEVLTQLFGAMLATAKIEFGDFTVYNVKLGIDEIINAYSKPTEDPRPFLDNLDTELLLSVKVKARDTTKAQEMAADLFTIFENAINYMVADINQTFGVGIYNLQPSHVMRTYIFSKEYITNRNLSSRPPFKVDLMEPKFNSPGSGNHTIWSLITKANPSKYEQRILYSVEWIGKAFFERDHSKSFLQFVIAIEAMLKYDPRQFISPSTASQLGEWLAFIIADEYEERKEVSVKMGELYRLRSAVGHGGNTEINKKDLLCAASFAKRLIWALLTKQEFKTISSIEELRDYITKLKFS